MKLVLRLIDSLARTLGRWALWLRTAPHLVSWCLLLSVAIIFVLLRFDYHEHQMPWSPASGVEITRGWRAAPWWITFYYFVSPYLKLAALLGGLVFQLTLWRAGADMRRMRGPLWIVCICYALWLGVADFHDEWQRVFSVATGRPFSVPAYALKVLLLIIACLSPAVALSWYQGRPLWEKYVLRTFAQPLLFCLLAFWALRLLFDLIDNLRDFQENGVSLVRLIAFYANLAPSMIVQATAPALVLAVLHTLVRLVRGNELISLLCAGLSFRRVLQPMLICAASVCLVAMALNYDWAPRAEGNREAMLRGMMLRQKEPVLANALMHYHESTRRLWFVSLVPEDLGPGKLRGVQVRQFNAEGDLEKGWSALSAWWDERTGTWTFSRGILTLYANGEIVNTVSYNGAEHGTQTHDEKDWPETLWDVVSHVFNPSTLGVPDLAVLVRDAQRLGGDARLQRQSETELWHRIAHPWQGFALLFLAAVLTPIHARQGLLRHVGFGILAYMGMLFLDNTTLNLARAGHLPAWIALWIPQVLFVVAASVVLLQRSGIAFTRRPNWREKWRILRGRQTEAHELPEGFFAHNPNLRGRRIRS